MYTAIIGIQNGGEERERVICALQQRKIGEKRKKEKERKRKERKTKGKIERNHGSKSRAAKERVRPAANERKKKRSSCRGGRRK